MDPVRTRYGISPAPHDQNLLKVMSGFHSTISPTTTSLKPFSLMGQKLTSPGPRVNQLLAPTTPSLTVSSPDSSHPNSLRFPLTRYFQSTLNDRKQGTSVLDLSTLGKSQGYITSSPVFEHQSPTRNLKNALSSRRNTLDPSQFIPKIVRRNSCSPALTGFQTLRRDSLRNAFVEEKLSVSSKVLGIGGFGAVYLGQLDRSTVAVKKFHTQQKNLKAKAESFRSELQAKTLIHPNIVRILAASRAEDFSKGIIVMEYVGDRNLHQVLLESNSPLSRHTMLSYALDLSRALDFIHGNSVVHLDLKPANVLITKGDICKLGDFGCCKKLHDGMDQISPTQRSYLTGTFAYRAPELLKGVPPCTKADIYSLGITMWQIYHRQLPYNGQNQHVVIFGVVAYNLRPDDEITEDTADGDKENIDNIKSIDAAYKAAYAQCWETDAEKRPCAKELTLMLEPYTSRCE